MKILIIFTGGTIGSSINNGTISPDNKTNYLILENYLNNNKCDYSPDFTCIEPYTVLSENLSAENINLLISTIKENHNKKFDGIIVTHGTDTIQYTASALAYAFSNINIPIILVSSNLPLSENNSNGNRNFEAAVKYIQNRAGQGVFVSYANPNENVKFHYANSILLHQETKEDILSLNSNEYAEYIDGKIVFNDKFKRTVFDKTINDFKLLNNSNILVVNCFPGSRYDYNLNNYDAIIFRPYHSGTLNTKNKCFVEFCECAKEYKIPSFVVNASSGNIYESAVLYNELGITVLPYSTFASIYIKIWIAISIKTDIKEFVIKPLAGEFFE